MLSHCLKLDDLVIFIQENVFENVDSNMTSIWSQPLWQVHEQHLLKELLSKPTPECRVMISSIHRYFRNQIAFENTKYHYQWDFESFSWWQEAKNISVHFWPSHGAHNNLLHNTSPIEIYLKSIILISTCIQPGSIVWFDTYSPKLYVYCTNFHSLQYRMGHSTWNRPWWNNSIDQKAISYYIHFI